MNAEEKIEQIHKLLDVLIDEAKEHERLQRVAKTKAGREYHSGYAIALRSAIHRVLNIIY